MATALYPGSFDPIHLGHLSVIRRAAAMFDRVVVAVIGNPDKPSGMFSIADRMALVAASVRDLPNVTCVAHRGLTVDAARHAGAEVVLRTGHKDAGDEWSMLAMNELMAGTKTFVLPPELALRGVSSSRVRSLVADGKVADACRLVPLAVAEALAARA